MMTLTNRCYVDHLMAWYRFGVSADETITFWSCSVYWLHLVAPSIIGQRGKFYWISFLFNNRGGVLIIGCWHTAHMTASSMLESPLPQRSALSTQFAVGHFGHKIILSPKLNATHSYFGSASSPRSVAVLLKQAELNGTNTGLTLRNNLRFSTLPNNTWTCQQEEPGIKPPTLWLVDRLLNLL